LESGRGGNGREEDGGRDKALDSACGGEGDLETDAGGLGNVVVVVVMEEDDGTGSSSRGVSSRRDWEGMLSVDIDITKRPLSGSGCDRALGLRSVVIVSADNTVRMGQ
jgi:hypothetical protein